MKQFMPFDTVSRSTARNVATANNGEIVGRFVRFSPAGACGAAFIVVNSNDNEVRYYFGETFYFAFIGKERWVMLVYCD